MGFEKSRPPPKGTFQSNPAREAREKKKLDIYVWTKVVHSAILEHSEERLRQGGQQW